MTLVRRVVMGVAMLSSTAAFGQAAAPAVTVRGGLVGPAKLEVLLPDGGYATVIAVGRGGEAGPMLVLSPQKPGDREPLKRGKWYAARALRPTDLLPFATMDSAVVIAFASVVPPVLANFTDGEHFASGLALPPAAMASAEALHGALASELFPNGEPHSVAMQMMPLTAEPRDSRLPPCPTDGVKRVPFVTRRIDAATAPIPRAPTCDPNRKPADAKP